MLDLLATGYPSLDHIVPVSRIPSRGETALLGEPINPLAAAYGGCGANVAVALQRFGFKTGVAMVLGADEAGERYTRYLQAEGVDCQNVLRLEGKSSPASYLFRTPDGEMVNFFHPGATDCWQGDLVLQGLESVRWGLVTVGYAPYNRAFVEQMTRANIPIIWQLKADIAAYPRESLEVFAAASRVIFCNHLEAKYLVEGMGLSALTDLLTMGPQVIVLTAGAEGSQVFSQGGAAKIPAVRCRVVDTTGAGDAYTAAFLAGYWREYDVLTCGRLGAVAAAFVVEAVGCQTNLPTWYRLLARYQESFGAS